MLKYVHHQSGADAVLATFERPQVELDQLTEEAQARALNSYSWEAVGKRVARILQSNKSFKDKFQC